MEVLVIQDLKKNFGSKEVLCGLNLSVPEHSIFGFIGKNGAGKTTTMKAILGLLNQRMEKSFVWVKRYILVRPIPIVTLAIYPMCQNFIPI